MDPKPEHKDINAPVNKKDKVTRLKGELYQGPLPHPQMMAAFEQIRPGSADDCFQMAKKEQSHQHKVDKLNLYLPFILQLTGQIFGFLLSAGFVGGGIFLLFLEKSLAGFTSLAVGIISIVGPLLFYRKSSTDSSKKSTKKDK